MTSRLMSEEQLINFSKYEPPNSPIRIMAEELLARRKEERETSPESIVVLWDHITGMDKEHILETLGTVCRKYTKLHGRYCNALQRAGELSVRLVGLQGTTDE